MELKKLVKISNIIGLISILLLMYWVFAFVLIEVFGLKVFREHMTGMFGLSILGILALMAGALMLNIMANLTRIAERGQEVAVASSKKLIYGVLLVFPVLAAILFGGNYQTIQQKHQLLEHSAQSLIQDNQQQVAWLADYRFAPEQFQTAKEILTLLNKQDSSFTQVSLIVPDQINGKAVLLNLSLDKMAYLGDKTQLAGKSDFLYATDLAEREYLNTAFQQQANTPRFDYANGHYVLLYPYQKDGETVGVLRLSDYQAYGKLGS
ncbi:peptidase [Neisseria sp. N95_16]|uniref:Peptidase n=1 Tax=Neisseria brasiliensis TaxID=2666100 RepID=A0A5Q3S1Z9_9NEIS|nr:MULTISPECIES: peptidase [Neisseria]MRN37030.1 peptidase [Neisseria brasiliensis]PJO10584.1 peptidase [Neisseria sp. N95_16]PJO77859.1 peptidase [Neisseria sp. N177_16]QGL25992.1 peptidase [Neisseria brasiliensis]